MNSRRALETGSTYALARDHKRLREHEERLQRKSRHREPADGEYEERELRVVRHWRSGQRAKAGRRVDLPRTWEEGIEIVDRKVAIARALYV